MDSTNFAYINDDAIGAAGGAESAYLITNEITSFQVKEFLQLLMFIFLSRLNHAQMVILIMVVVNGDGYSEDLFFMVSSDYGGTWTVVDSTLGGNPNWTSRMFEITDELNGATSFIAALLHRL